MNLMKVRPSDYRGWKLVREYQVGRGHLFEFEFPIRNLLIRQVGRFRSRKRMLRPVLLRLIIGIRRKGKMKKLFFHIIGIKLFGHPTMQWHPHLITGSNGDCRICWGRGTWDRLQYSRSLKNLLEDNLWKIMGVLGDFTQRGYHHVSQTRTIWTYPIKKGQKNILDRLDRIESLPESFWRES